MTNPYPINTFLKYLVKIWMTVFTWYYKISANISPELKMITEPYLLLSNHYGRYDPFIISNFIKQRPNFISSDAILRDRLIGTLFKGLGAMPKKKGVRDTHIIREMLKVVQSGGSLALFPEGTRTWSGETLYIDPSIAKLIKLLGIPVITARMKGSYFYDPRWSGRIRRSGFEIDYKLAMSKDEVSKLTDKEVYTLIQNNLYQDDIEYQRQVKTRIRSGKRAEYIELVLFQCPKCKSYGGFVSKGNNFSCLECSKAILVNKYGFLEAVEGKGLAFDNIRDWFEWQNSNFVQSIKQMLREKLEEPYFSASDMEIEFAIGEGRMNKLGVGEVCFYSDRLKIITPNSEEELFHKKISSLGPQLNERIELFYNDRAYRFTSKSQKEPGVKWELAINVVWANAGDNSKLSPYFKDLVQASKS